MVTGLNIFRDYFADDTDKYVLIGGAACDIVFTSNDATFLLYLFKSKRVMWNED